MEWFSYLPLGLIAPSPRSWIRPNLFAEIWCRSVVEWRRPAAVWQPLPMAVVGRCWSCASAIAAVAAGAKAGSVWFAIGAFAEAVQVDWRRSWGRAVMAERCRR